MFEVELSNYFNNNHSPKDQFGSMLFDNWPDKEWQLFDKFMINCLQFYLENGLVGYEHVNLEIRKLNNATSQEFVDFMVEQELFNGQRINYKELRNQFMNDYEDYRMHKWFNQKIFNSWLARYVGI